MQNDPSPQRDSGEQSNPKPSPKLLEALVCPVTGGPLVWDASAGELISRRAHLAFPVRSGIPILLVDEARKIPD